MFKKCDWVQRAFLGIRFSLRVGDIKHSHAQHDWSPDYFGYFVKKFSDISEMGEAKGGRKKRKERKFPRIKIFKEGDCKRDGKWIDSFVKNLFNVCVNL